MPEFRPRKHDLEVAHSLGGSAVKALLAHRIDVAMAARLLHRSTGAISAAVRRGSLPYRLYTDGHRNRIALALPDLERYAVLAHAPVDYSVLPLAWRIEWGVDDPSLDMPDVTAPHYAPMSGSPVLSRFTQ